MTLFLILFSTELELPVVEDQVYAITHKSFKTHCLGLLIHHRLDCSLFRLLDGDHTPF